MSSIDFYKDANTGIITLRNSIEGNRFNLPVLTELRQALSNALSDDDLRAVLLRSDGEVFSLGMDFSSLTDPVLRKQQVKESIILYAEIVKTITSCAVPVIALLQGPVKAGGVGIAASADIVIATPNTSFQLSEVFFGLLPANVLPYLVGWRLSPQKARYLVLTAKQVEAKEAYAMGLIDELVAPEDCEKELKKIMKNLFRSSPPALAEAKEFTALLSGIDFETRQQEAKKKLLELLNREEVIEAVSSFESGGLPEWFSSFKPQRSLTKHSTSTGRSAH